MDKNKGVLCIGNIIMDSYASIEEDFLTNNNIKKGSAPILDPLRVIELTQNLNFVSSNLGGSAVNVAKVIGFFGGNAGVLGQFADDESGKRIMQEIKKYNMKNYSLVQRGGITTQLFALITPDAQRTMLAIFGASHQIEMEHIDFSMLKKFSYILIEGYQFCNKNLIDVTYKAVEIAIGLGIGIILSLSNIFCVDNYLDHMHSVMRYAKFLSGNKEEFLRLFEIEDTDELIKKMEKLTAVNGRYEVIILTMGKEGAYIFSNGKKIFEPADVTQKAVDTTGAGDFFLGGFLYGYFLGLDLKICSKIAGITAGEVCRYFGCNVNEDLKNRIENILEVKQ